MLKTLFIVLLAAFFVPCLYSSLAFAQSRSHSVKTMPAKMPINVEPAAKAALPAAYKTYLSGSVYSVKLDKTVLKALKIGEKFKLHLAEGEYIVVHDNRMEHPNGDLTWVGHLEPQGSDLDAG